MPVTIYTQEPGKYHVQKTIGGYVVVFIEDAHNCRNVDGGKVHKNRQNAYKKADRLNHPLKYILKKYDAAYTEFDGYTATVSEYVGCENFKYTLSIQKEMLPPHFTVDCETLEDVEKEMKNSFFPQNLNWQAVKPEEI